MPSRRELALRSLVRWGRCRLRMGGWPGKFEFVLLLVAVLLAQVPGSAQNASIAGDGVTRGGYQIHSSGELGYRATNITGSGDMYDTLDE